MLKPRDIKHRDKLRVAFTTLATLEEAPSPVPGSKLPSDPYVWGQPLLLYTGGYGEFKLIFNFKFKQIVFTQPDVD